MPLLPNQSIFFWSGGMGFEKQVENHKCVEISNLVVKFLNYNSTLSLIKKTITCSDSTLPVYGFRPKIALTCEITLIKKYKLPITGNFLPRKLWNCVYLTHLPHLKGFRLSKSVFCHLLRAMCLLKTRNVTSR